MTCLLSICSNVLFTVKGRDGTIVLHLLSVTFFKHWRPLSHFPRTRPFPQLHTAVVEIHLRRCNSTGQFLKEFRWCSGVPPTGLVVVVIFKRLCTSSLLKRLNSKCVPWYTSLRVLMLPWLSWFSSVLLITSRSPAMLQPVTKMLRRSHEKTTFVASNRC